MKELLLSIILISLIAEQRSGYCPETVVKEDKCKDASDPVLPDLDASN